MRGNNGRHMSEQQTILHLINCITGELSLYGVRIL